MSGHFGFFWAFHKIELGVDYYQRQLRFSVQHGLVPKRQNDFFSITPLIDYKKSMNPKMSSLSTNLPPLLAARVLELHPDPVQRPPISVLERTMAPEYKNLPSIFEMEKLNTRFWLHKASEQAYRDSGERNMALILPPIRVLRTRTSSNHV